MAERSSVEPKVGRPARPSRPERDAARHYRPAERRFPFCGSWRSNWNQTSDRADATCPQCLALLATTAGDGSGGTR